jgi:hypothetical protein
MECGHVFCLNCLLSWFDKAYAKFIARHPGGNPLSQELQAVLQHPHDNPKQWGEAYSSVLQLPHPHYMCPTCRAAVTRRPLEDLKVKGLVLWFTSAEGVEAPEPVLQPGQNATVFDGYCLL